MARARPIAPLLLAVAVTAIAAGLTACDGASDAATPVGAAATTTTAAAVSTTAAPTTTTTTAPPPPPPTTAPPPVRNVATQPWGTPFAEVGGVTLVHPSDRVERIGFHQSNHEGARELVPLATAVNATTLESRERLSSGRTAADVVVDPTATIRAPVTGRVLRAGTYVLYCKHSDDYVVIEPDGHPGWEVKILHINGEQVSRGQRVEAGVTQIAPRATQLPFESQVDELSTAQPAWPHVHIEVVDPSIPNIPSPGGGC